MNVKDKNERKHRRTTKHPECVATMAGADFGAVPSLSEAMGLEPVLYSVKIVRPAVGESRDGTQQRNFPPGTFGEYVCHVPLGMLVLRIDGQEWVVHPGATAPHSRGLIR